MMKNYFQYLEGVKWYNKGRFEEDDDFKDVISSDDYKPGDWVVVLGYDYSLERNGIKGIIVTQLIENNIDDIIHGSREYITGVLKEDAYFIVKNDNRLFHYVRISKKVIQRYATPIEITTAKNNGEAIRIVE